MGVGAIHEAWLAPTDHGDITVHIGEWEIGTISATASGAFDQTIREATFREELPKLRSTDSSAWRPAALRHRSRPTGSLVRKATLWPERTRVPDRSMTGSVGIPPGRLRVLVDLAVRSRSGPAREKARNKPGPHQRVIRPRPGVDADAPATAAGGRAAAAELIED